MSYSIHDSPRHLPAAGPMVAIAAMLAGAFAPLRGQTRLVDRDDASPKTPLVSTLESEGLTVIARLIEAAGLADDFAASEPLTLFAPHNAAFAEIAEDAVKGMDRARSVVFHLTASGTTTVLDVLDGSEEVAGLRPFRSPSGLTVELHDGEPMTVRDSDQTARVIGEPIFAGDHVIHVIDRVLLPEPGEGPGR